MSEGLDQSLLIAACVTSLIGYWLVSRDLPKLLAGGIVSIKILIPLVYFGYFYNTTWNFLDDLNYCQEGERLFALGYNPFLIFFSPEGRLELFISARGPHILYYWWNMLATYLFGPHYYSPIYLNIILIFLSGILLVRLAKCMDFSSFYSKCLLVFFLLHFEILFWSSFVNVKDIMVMTLTIAAFYFIVKLTRRFNYYYLIALVAVFYIFYWIRFYVPILILGSTLAWLALFQKRRTLKLALMTGAVAIVLGGLLLKVGVDGIVEMFSRLEQIQDFSFNYLKMALTPRPWGIQPAYTFLLIPSILHWIFFIPVTFSCLVLWKSCKPFILLLIYVMLIMGFNAYSEELLEVRHRFQVSFIIAWLQFHFIWMLIQPLISSRKKIVVSSA